MHCTCTVHIPRTTLVTWEVCLLLDSTTTVGTLCASATGGISSRDVLAQPSRELEIPQRGDGSMHKYCRSLSCWAWPQGLICMTWPGGEHGGGADPFWLPTLGAKANARCEFIIRPVRSDAAGGLVELRAPCVCRSCRMRLPHRSRAWPCCETPGAIGSRPE
jgi:hypothetical protein